MRTRILIAASLLLMLSGCGAVMSGVDALIPDAVVERDEDGLPTELDADAIAAAVADGVRTASTQPAAKAIADSVPGGEIVLAALVAAATAAGTYFRQRSVNKKKNKTLVRSTQQLWEGATPEQRKVVELVQGPEITREVKAIKAEVQ
jgi:hypothetical protein